MNLAILARPEKLVSYLKLNALIDEEIFLPTEGIGWGGSYYWMVGHNHPELNTFLREMKFGKPLRIWTITMLTVDTEARLIEALDRASDAKKKFVVHAAQKMTLPMTVLSRVRYLNLVSHRGTRRKPWTLEEWRFKLEVLSRRKRHDLS